MEFNRELLEKLSYLMSIKNNSDQTIKSYTSSLRYFFAFIKKQSKDISKNDFINYLKFITNKNVSHSFHNQFINAWKMYLKQIHGKELKYGNEYRPLKTKKLPNVLSESEIITAIQKCTNLKHKAMIAILFSTGMRRSELLNLKIKDIDSENMVIHIRQGKGFKDRKNPLKENILKILRDYYIKEKPEFFLFEGDKGGKYTPSSLYNVVRKHLNTNPHNIRHSRGTNIIDRGGDVTDVKAMFGHSSTKTSEIYVHTSVMRLNKLHDPFYNIAL